MKANLTLHNGKIKVGYGVQEDYPIQVSMTKEVFGRIVLDALTLYRRSYDVRDITTHALDSILQGEPKSLEELRFENLRKFL